MTPPARTRGTRVELYCRESLPTPVRSRRKHVSDRLAELVDAGDVASFEVHDWPKRVPRDGTAGAENRDLFLAFSQWATEEGVCLSPFFGTRTCYSMDTAELGEWIVFPGLCLAVYEDDELATVYPHADGDAYLTVLDGVASLGSSGEDRSEKSERLIAGRAD